VKTSIWIVITLAALGLLSASAVAQQPHGEYYPSVDKVEVGDDGFLYIRAGNFLPSHGCSQPYFARSKYPLSDDRTRAWLQISLASYLSKRRVYVENTGCTSYGHLLLTKLQLAEDQP